MSTRGTSATAAPHRNFAAQQKLLRAHADEKGLVVRRDAIFEDVETAKNPGRKEFGRMVEYLQAHPECRTLLVEKTDRLYRNLKDRVIIDELGVEIHFVKEGVVLSKESKSADKFMHGIRVLMARNYIDNLSEEIKKGMHEKAAQGLWPSYAPLGYANIKRPDGKNIIEPDPDTAGLVAQLFERYATGNYSLVEITKLARSLGLRYQKSGRVLPKSAIHRLLRNKVYSGDFDWAGKEYRGSYAALISRELWNRVQDILEGRNQGKPHSVRDRFAFAGLLTCGHCGCALVAELKKGRYAYYHCTGYKGKCPEKYVREEVLEAAFTELLGVSTSKVHDGVQAVSDHVA